RMTRRVAITGLGFVTPLGTDVQSTWEGLVAGRSGAGRITRFDPAQSPVKFACEVKGFEPARFLDKKEIRRYDLFAQFALGAAEQAVTDACLASNWDKVDLKRVGAIVGTGTGGLQTFEENARALFEKGPSRLSPFLVPMYMPNVAAALISMRYRGSTHGAAARRSTPRSRASARARTRTTSPHRRPTAPAPRKPCGSPCATRESSPTRSATSTRTGRRRHTATPRRPPP